MGIDPRVKVFENAFRSGTRCYLVDWGECDVIGGTVYFTDGRREEVTLSEYCDRFADEFAVIAEYEGDTNPIL